MHAFRSNTTERNRYSPETNICHSMSYRLKKNDKTTSNICNSASHSSVPRTNYQKDLYSSLKLLPPRKPDYNSYTEHKLPLKKMREPCKNIKNLNMKTNQYYYSTNSGEPDEKQYRIVPMLYYTPVVVPQCIVRSNVPNTTKVQEAEKRSYLSVHPNGNVSFSKTYKECTHSRLSRGYPYYKNNNVNLEEQSVSDVSESSELSETSEKSVIFDSEFESDYSDYKDKKCNYMYVKPDMNNFSSNSTVTHQNFDEEFYKNKIVSSGHISNNISAKKCCANKISSRSKDYQTHKKMSTDLLARKISMNKKNVSAPAENKPKKYDNKIISDKNTKLIDNNAVCQNEIFKDYDNKNTLEPIVSNKSTCKTEDLNNYFVKRFKDITDNNTEIYEYEDDLDPVIIKSSTSNNNFKNSVDTSCEIKPIEIEIFEDIPLTKKSRHDSMIPEKLISSSENNNLTDFNGFKETSSQEKKFLSMYELFSVHMIDCKSSSTTELNLGESKDNNVSEKEIVIDTTSKDEGFINDIMCENLIDTDEAKYSSKSLKETKYDSENVLNEVLKKIESVMKSKMDNVRNAVPEMDEESYNQANDLNESDFESEEDESETSFISEKSINKEDEVICDESNKIQHKSMKRNGIKEFLLVQNSNITIPLTLTAFRAFVEYVIDISVPVLTASAETTIVNIENTMIDTTLNEMCINTL